MTKKHQHRPAKRNQFNAILALLVLLLMIAAGILIIRSRAAQPAQVVNAASGNRTTNAQVVTDSSAAGGSAVQFTGTAASDKTIVAAGDIACDPKSPNFNGGNGNASGCHMLATSNLVQAINPDKVLVLGDNQYESATLANYLASYDKSWGRFKSKTAPVLGNHENGESASGSAAKGYFDYFNGTGNQTGPAGNRSQGYYSYNLGSWHIIALNANCGSFFFDGSTHGCDVGSPQYNWLQTDLQNDHATCTLAYFHTALFSSGHDGDSTAQNDVMKNFWQLLYQYNADVVLNGHSHDYERFAPQDPNGRADPARGLTEFVVGVGGRDFTGWLSVNRKPNSVISQNNTFGVLKMTLRSNSFDYQFTPEAGKTFTDKGSQLCH